MSTEDSDSIHHATANLGGGESPRSVESSSDNSADRDFIASSDDEDQDDSKEDNTWSEAEAGTNSSLVDQAGGTEQVLPLPETPQVRGRSAHVTIFNTRGGMDHRDRRRESYPPSNSGRGFSDGIPTQDSYQNGNPFASGGAGDVTAGQQLANRSTFALRELENSARTGGRSDQTSAQEHDATGMHDDDVSLSPSLGSQLPGRSGRDGGWNTRVERLSRGSNLPLQETTGLYGGQGATRRPEQEDRGNAEGLKRQPSVETATPHTPREGKAMGGGISLDYTDFRGIEEKSGTHGFPELGSVGEHTQASDWNRTTRAMDDLNGALFKSDLERIGRLEEASGAEKIVFRQELLEVLEEKGSLAPVLALPRNSATSSRSMSSRSYMEDYST